MKKKAIIASFAITLCGALPIFASVSGLAGKLTSTSNSISTSVSVSVSEPVAINGMVGDANEDGKVDTLDALRILRYTLGKAELTPQGLKNADANVDGKVDTLDALRILRYTLGKATLGE